MLAIYNRRPYLIWANATQSSKTPETVSSQPSPASAPTKLFQISLRWSSLRHGKWSKVQQSLAWIPDEKFTLFTAERQFEVAASTDDSVSYTHLRAHETP